MGRRIHEIKGMRYVGMTSPGTLNDVLSQTELDYFKNYDYILENNGAEYRAIFYDKDPTWLKDTKERIRKIF